MANSDPTETPTALANLPQEHPIHTTHRHINWLLISFSALSVVFLVTTLILTKFIPSDVNSTVWTKAIAVVIVSALYFFFAYKLRQGKYWAYRRLRLTSIFGTLGIIYIVVAPDKYPLWARAELAVQGLILLGLAWVITRPHVREAFDAQR